MERLRNGCYRPVLVGGGWYGPVVVGAFAGPRGGGEPGLGLGHGHGLDRCLDQQHGSAWWSHVCQRATQSPRGGVLTAQAARGKIFFLSTARSCKRPSLYATACQILRFWRHAMPAARACSYGGRSWGVFGALTYPHLILPYSAYYGHLASHYGGLWCSPTGWWCN